MGRAASRKEGLYWALMSRDWRGMEWRRDHFRGMRELEGEIQLCLTPRESLQSKTCRAALLPKKFHMGELVVGEGLGSGGPRSLRSHGR